MAYDEALAERIRDVLGKRKGIAEQKMFGGLAFLRQGNMCCGVLGKNLVLRLGEEGAAEALLEAHTRPMDFTGRPMKTMFYVAPEGHASDEALEQWVGDALKIVSTLPAK